MSEHLFVDIDGAGDLTLWRASSDNPGYPEPVARKCDLGDDAWHLLIVGVAALEALADWDEYNPSHGSYRQAAAQLRHVVSEYEDPS